MTLGLLKAVVSMKKVISKHIRSTIGVMSMWVLCFLALRFPPFFPFSS